MYVRWIMSNCFLYSKLLKVAPCDDIKFRFYFCNEVVYPPDHDFFFLGFLDLKKYFLSTFL